MKAGIGLPNAVRGVGRAGIVEWAQSAEQAATLDSLSGCRLTLGLVPGGRKDDFDASGVDFGQRGRIFEQQLGEMTAVWRGEGGIGPETLKVIARSCQGAFFAGRRGLRWWSR